MVFNYSDNIAAGYGVVYVPGGEKVDGASDLLFTFVLAGLVWLGMPVQVGAAVVNGLSLGVIALLVFLSWRRGSLGRHWLPIAAVGVLLATTPVFFLGAAGFGTLFFAALAATTAYLVQRADANASLTALVSIGISVAVTGLDRIEGFLLAGLIVLAEAFATKSLRLVAIPAVTAGLIAIAWFSWRWSYFGYPLPNPFYRKSGIYLGSAKVAFVAVLEFAAPWIPLFAAGVLCTSTRRRMLSYFALIVVPWTSIWVFLSNEMNVANRFQFPIAPILVVLCGTMIEPIIQNSKGLLDRFGAQGLRRFTASTLAFLSFMALTTWPTTIMAQHQWIQAATYHQAVTDAINRASLDSELIATTEAGMVAWRSRLPVVDLWGLNDKRIAHKGLLSPSDIAKLGPQILWSHLGRVETLAAGEGEVKDGSWDRMNINLFCFAERNGFEPAAIWREEIDDWWVVLAKSGTPLLDRLRKELSRVQMDGSDASFNTSIPAVRDCPSDASARN